MRRLWDVVEVAGVVTIVGSLGCFLALAVALSYRVCWWLLS